MENDINNQGEAVGFFSTAEQKQAAANSSLLQEQDFLRTSPNSSILQKPDLLEKIDPPTERYKDTSQLRRHTGYWVMIVVSQWLFVVICLVILVGLRSLELTDSVIITLLGTTTVNIIGLPFVLLKGLYPQDKEISKLSDEISKLTKQKCE
jgi:hypothetical protein|nr:MAG TPA: hypothetical protein [Caudoviricetes sp.]